MLHADEPLRRGAEDDRALVPPTVRIAVFDFGALQEAAFGFEFGNDQGIGFPHGFSGQR